ncbi:MAG TPA: ankyrin repeat domain-containing protein [Vicinamibacterales bacterium]
MRPTLVGAASRRLVIIGACVLALTHGLSAQGQTTPLLQAVLTGERVAVQRVIASGADVNAANRYGVTPLVLAAQRGRGDLIELLLKAGASVKTAEAKLPEGQTLVMHAARTGDIASLRALITAGSNVNARETRTGTTAAIWAASGNRANAIRVLAEAGAELDVLSKVTSYPHTQNGVLLSGLEEGYSYVGQTVLPRGGWSAVMFAAREGAADAVRALAESGANLNLTDPEGTTALVLAVINGHYDVVSALIEKGADPNIADIKGMTPLYAAVDMHTIGDTFGRPYPAKPVIDGSLDAARVLIKGGANVNARLTAPILKRVYDAGDNRLGDGATPFMRAARKCDVEMMRILLDAKADVTLTQKSGNTPLMLCAGAVSAGNSEDTPERVSQDEALAAIRLALDAGVDVNAQNATGDTALHTAATSGGGQPAIIRLLVERGARLDMKNKADRTPLDAASRARQPNEKIVALLRELAAR